jgi:hypothetical protein
MAIKTAKGKLTIEFPETKLHALEFCMREKGADLEDTVAQFISSLYEKNVPKIMKGFLENSDKSIENQEGISHE